MFDKLFICEYEEVDKYPFTGFKFAGINCGWLGIGFYKDGYGVGLDFDEWLYDPIPEMVKMCLKLKMNESFSFFLPDIRRGMYTEILENDNVRFVVFEGWEKEKTYYDQIFDRFYCISLLENVFEDLLTCKDYPKQYPFFTNLDKCESSKIYIEAEEYCKVHGIDDWEESDDYEKELINEKVPLNDFAAKEFNKYDLMLRKHIVPNGW